MPGLKRLPNDCLPGAPASRLMPHSSSSLRDAISEGGGVPDKGDPAPKEGARCEKAREAYVRLDDEQIEAAHEVDDAARHIPGFLGNDVGDGISHFLG